MGCLDPKMDKERAFALLRKKGATQAVLEFSGGNDEGGVNSIVLTIPKQDDTDPEVDLEVWYCGGYTYLPNGGYQRSSEPANEDQELSELLQGPVDEAYGTWAGDFSAYGTLTWDVKTGEVRMDKYEQSEYEHSHEVY